ncbi:MAG: flagellar filament capping protein FliD [Thiohalorhabdus sp.]|uniref:flagellar filament capping protein FliD n=1 Tax=Thiohalorhabdus sp. TaxID=3094134 RepID=UPI002FC3263A
MAIGTISNVYPGGERPSGLPADITQRLVDAKRQQVVQPLEADRQELSSQTELMKKLNSVTQSVGDAAGKLNGPSDLKAYSASSSNGSAISVGIEGAPSEGSYRVDVTQVAQAHNHLVGASDGTDDATVTAGVTDPDDAAAINDGIEVSFAHGGSDYTYTTDSDTTLNDLASTIREADNGVQASAVNIGTSDSPAYALQLKSETTGGGSEQRITDTTGATGVQITDTNGNSASLFSGGTEQEEAQAGQNAGLTVDGVAYTRSTNEITDVIDGLTLNLREATSTEATIDVSRTPDQASQSMQAMVDAVNKVGGFIDQNTSYDPETGEAGPLIGNSTVRQVDSALRQTLGEQVPGTENQDLQYLNQVGVSFDRQGQLTFDAKKFEQALSEQPDQVQNLLTGDEGAMARLSERIDGLTNSTDGAITAALDSLDSRDSRLQDQIEEAKNRVQGYDQRISDRYAQLEKTVIELQGIEDNISQIIGGASSGG